MPEPVVAADQVGLGHEPVLEGDLVGVHAPVAEGVDRPALEPPRRRSAGRRAPASWAKTKPCPSPRRLLARRTCDRPRWACERSGSVRASSMSTSARAANVHHVLTPLIDPAAVDAAWPPSRCRPRRSRSRARSPRPRPGPRPRPAWAASACFCSSVPPSTSARVRISGRVMSEPPTPSEPQRQLLGGDDHAQVVALAARGEAAVLLGDRQPEAAHLGQAGDDLLGDVAVGRGGRARRGGGSAPRRSGGTCRARARSRSSRWRGPSTPASAARTAGSRSCAHEGRRRRDPAGLDAPERLAPGDPADQVGQRRRRRRRRRCGPRSSPWRRSRGRPGPWRTAAAAWARS